MKRAMTAVSIVMFTTAMGVYGAEFLPLAPGNHWTYQDAASGESFTVQVEGTQFYLNQNVYHVLKGYTPNKLLVRTHESGNLVFWDMEREVEVVLTSFETMSGGLFDAGARQCPEIGQAQPQRVEHSGPAGRWGTVEIKYTPFACADAGDVSEQFAENIGMVQRVVNTIAGPRTFNLIYAKLGNQLIAAGNPGIFSVAALPGRESGTWNATLRLDQPLGSQMKLQFASGQEYELRLRDSNGSIVWTWSADKLFTEGGHSVPVRNGWSASVTVPYPPAIFEGPQLYTLEAWLTNVESDPRFAASTRVDIP